LDIFQPAPEVSEVSASSRVLTQCFLDWHSRAADCAWIISLKCDISDGFYFQESLVIVVISYLILRCYFSRYPRSSGTPNSEKNPSTVECTSRLNSQLKSICRFLFDLLLGAFFIVESPGSFFHCIRISHNSRIDIIFQNIRDEKPA